MCDDGAVRGPGAGKGEPMTADLLRLADKEAASYNKQRAFHYKQ